MRRIGCVRATAALASTLAAAAAAAQSPGPERQLIVEAIYDRPAGSGGGARGAGAELELTWGDERRPVRLGTAVGLDFERQPATGQRRLGLDADVTVQPGGGRRLTPLAGVGVSLVRLSGGGESARLRPGLEGIVGLQYDLRRQGPVALQAELRRGAVRGEPPSTSGRAGVVLTP